MSQKCVTVFWSTLSHRNIIPEVGVKGLYHHSPDSPGPLSDDVPLIGDAFAAMGARKANACSEDACARISMSDC